MPLLVEQERLVAQEVNLINDSTTYGFGTTWGTVHDYGNIVLSAAAIVLIKFDFECAAVNIGDNVWLRVKVGSNYVYGQVQHYPGSWQTVGIAIYLAAGTYDILVEGKYSGNYGYIRNFQAGISAFNDVQGANVRTYSSGIALTVANRNTPAGALQNACYLVQCWATTSGGYTAFENVGDNFTNGVSISVDGAQKNWDERIQDDSGNAVSGIASAKCAQSLVVGSSHTVTISKRNASTSVVISVIACPWILPNVLHVPVNIYFSQGSTLYCMLEPLFLNATKFVGVGAIHGITWGTVDDYYSSLSGVDLVPFSFMMDIEDILNNNLIVYGLGGCIGIIGVDAR
jgi:hypothetical protein